MKAKLTTTQKLPTDLACILAACEQAGFADGLPEYRFDKVRKWRFDLYFPVQRVGFEREGSTWAGGRHTRGKGYRNDCEKYNAAAIAGIRVIRATVDMIRSGLALEQLLAALGARS